MKKAPSYETQELREFARTLRGRRTIDQFIQTAVPKELVLEAIEVATWAPNHYVSEPWRFILPGKETIRRIVDLNATIVAERKSPEHGEHKRRQWSEKPGWLIVTCRISCCISGKRALAPSGRPVQSPGTSAFSKLSASTVMPNSSLA